MANMPYRRPTVQVHVGNITIGSGVDVVLQSMTTTPTLDTEASVAQVKALAGAGAQLVRLTAQAIAHAANLANIERRLAEDGCEVPLVADIHFVPAVAMEAAKHVEKVRINPGNFYDPGRTFRKMEFTDEEYAAEIEKLGEKFASFLDLCRQNGTAVRIGVNHGSLSDRIMSRFGDGAEGMVESALEFMRVCQRVNFDDVVVSIKASDVSVMTDTVRLLVERMAAEGLAYPLHLGVTEAGNALEGRVKSAVGIGSLLSDGIGDTIRVSLSEDPCNEIPVARFISEYAGENARMNYVAGVQRRGRCGGRRKTVVASCGIGGNNPVGVVGDTLHVTEAGVEVLRISERDKISRARRVLAESGDAPVAIVLAYNGLKTKEEVITAAAVDLGTLLLDGYRDAIGLESDMLTAQECVETCRMIIQACGLARYKADIVACPGCGRTLYNLQEVLDTVKPRFEHLRHLKIAVMGCIVNGPGEMAGADYGYVGGAKGMVSLYRGVECVRRDIPQAEAPDVLEQIIREDGQWTDPE